MTLTFQTYDLDHKIESATNEKKCEAEFIIN